MKVIYAKINKETLDRLRKELRCEEYWPGYGLKSDSEHVRVIATWDREDIFDSSNTHEQLGGIQTIDEDSVIYIKELNRKDEEFHDEVYSYEKWMEIYTKLVLRK